MADVKGAGDTSTGNNPTVTSKFDRMHGQPRTPAKVTHPGGTAPVTGSKVAGHTEAGHQLPRETAYAKETHVVSKVAAPQSADTGALDRPSYGK